MPRPRPTPLPTASAAAVPPSRNYRRADVAFTDDDGFVWVNPSPTAWPNVRGNPPGPRTQIIGYNRETRTVRTIFRDGTPWEYRDVPPDVWERTRRTASTGRFIARVLDGYPYGRKEFPDPRG
jgi:hypothetical protein